MRIAIIAVALLLAAPVAGEDTTSLEELLASFGYDLANAEIRTEKVGEGLYVLFGVGGNIAASIGTDSTPTRPTRCR